MDKDPAVADRAKSCLLTQSLESLQVALARPDADLKLFEYCADNMGGRPEVADRMAANAASFRVLGLKVWVSFTWMAYW